MSNSLQHISFASRVKSFVLLHERRLSLFIFVFGFVWDNVMLRRIDRLFDMLVLAGYLVIAFAAICLLNTPRLRQARVEESGGGADAAKTSRLKKKIVRKTLNFAEFMLPFSFGGLFSAFLIFYSRSGTVLSSAPFLLILAGLFLGNEFLRRQYARFIFQMSIFFVTLFSYAVLITPVLVGELGDRIFVAGGLVSLALFWVCLRILSRVAKEQVHESRYALWSVVATVFITFNVLYFNNMIPPIPLSLKEIGVYHDIVRTRSGAYRLSFEAAPWYEFGKKTSDVFHLASGKSAYVFSSVFAPARLDTDITHHWSYFDTASREWVDSAVVSFPISGGRDEGFRGYSKKESITPGTWRVDVETLRGQIIGRIVFRVEEVPTALELTESVR